MSEAKLPASWARTTLEPLGKLYCGQSLTASKVNRDGKGVPYVTGPEQWDGEKVHEDKWTNEPARMAPDGCIFITVKGAGVGKLFPGIACAIGRDVYAYHPCPELPRKFIELSLRFTIAQVVAEAKGDIPGLSKNHILEHSIPLPPISEQKRIVAKIEELFSELDAGKESLRRARRQLGVYRQSLLKQAFEGKLTAPWRAQHPDLLESPDQLVDRIQEERQARYDEQLVVWQSAMTAWESDDAGEKRPAKPKRPKPATLLTADEAKDLSSLPASWAWLRFESAALESVLGKMLDKAKNKGVPRPYLRNINVRWGTFDLSELLEMKIEKAEEPRYRVVCGDLVICEGGEPGRCAVWNAPYHPEIFLQKALHRVRFTQSVSPHYVAHLLPFLAATKQLDPFFTGTTIKHLTGKGLAAVPIPLSSLPEQKEIVRLLDGQFEVIEQNEREIDAALKRSEALRQSILRKAFTGQLVPQDPGDEPASALLASIQAEREEAAKKTKKKATRKTSSKKPSRKLKSEPKPPQHRQPDLFE